MPSEHAYNQLNLTLRYYEDRAVWQLTYELRSEQKGMLGVVSRAVPSQVLMDRWTAEQIAAAVERALLASLPF